MKLIALIALLGSVAVLAQVPADAAEAPNGNPPNSQAQKAHPVCPKGQTWQRGCLKWVEGKPGHEGYCAKYTKEKCMSDPIP